MLRNNIIYTNARYIMKSTTPLISFVMTFLTVIFILSLFYLLTSIYFPTFTENNIPPDFWVPPKIEEVILLSPNQHLDTNEIILRPVFSKNKNPLSMNKNRKITKSNKNYEFIQPDGLGIILSAIVNIHDDWRAFIKSKNDPNGTWKLTGEGIDEWSIDSIENNKITLRNDNRYTEIILFGKKSDK